MPNILLRWFPLAVLAIALSGSTYLLVQQSLRMSANDPQIQMAEDYIPAMQGNLTAQVDMQNSLAPFYVIYDASGKPIAGTGYLHGALPMLPGGTSLLEYAKAHGEDRVSWQPEQGVRIAAVVKSINGTSDFVLAGRNLREVEIRINQATENTGIILIVTLIGIFVACWLVELKPKRT